MTNRILKTILIFILGFNIITVNAQIEKTILTIQDQGTFTVGGSVRTIPGTFDPIKQGSWMMIDSTGQTIHGDAAAVYYQIPVKAKKYPLVFWHGHGGTSRCWQTTFDGREGFNNIFLRRNFPVYLIEQPRRGNAGKPTKSAKVDIVADEQTWFGIFRFGQWPNYYEGVQFPKDDNSLTEFFNGMIPDIGPYDPALNVNAMDALFNKIGSGILVTHSQSGGLGWQTLLKNDKIKGLVAFEPGGDFIFPEGDATNSFNLFGFKVPLQTVPMSEFKKFTKMPIIIYYGDNIPTEPSTNAGKEQWRTFLDVARKWRDVVNKNGGNVTLIHLPEVGIKGNTHFPFADLNNVQVADHLSKWLKEKGLNK